MTLLEVVTKNNRWCQIQIYNIHNKKLVLTNEI